MQDYSKLGFLVTSISTLVSLVGMLLGGGGMLALTWNNILAMFFILVAFGFSVFGLVWSFKKEPKKDDNLSKIVNVHIDFTKMKKEQIDALMIPLRDMSSAQIESFIGDIHATGKKTTTLPNKQNKKTTQKKDNPS